MISGEFRMMARMIWLLLFLGCYRHSAAEWNPQKRLAPAVGTFKFESAAKCQRVSASIEDGCAKMVKSLEVFVSEDDIYGTSL